MSQIHHSRFHGLPQNLRWYHVKPFDSGTSWSFWVYSAKPFHLSRSLQSSVWYRRILYFHLCHSHACIWKDYITLIEEIFVLTFLSWLFGGVLICLSIYKNLFFDSRACTSISFSLRWHRFVWIPSIVNDRRRLWAGVSICAHLLVYGDMIEYVILVRGWLANTLLLDHPYGLNYRSVYLCSSKYHRFMMTLRKKIPKKRLTVHQSIW